MSQRPVILFVSHESTRCGVYQFGRNVADALAGSRRFSFQYVECGSADAYVDAVQDRAPAAVIYNYYPTTMPWLQPRILRPFDLPHVGLIHEVTQRVADVAGGRLFDFHVAADPTLVLRNPFVYKTGRLIPSYRNERSVPSVPTIGSFGFGTRGKGFERLIDAVQEQFDEAIVRLHIPFADFGDREGVKAREIASRCRARLRKSRIELEFSHQFLSQAELLDFLGENSLNAFFYDEQKGRGIASVTDYALAVQRPLAITRSLMFRHLLATKPSICIEDSTLPEILERGTAPLRRYVSEWTTPNLVWDYERIVESVLTRARPSFREKAVAAVRRLVGAAGTRIGIDWTPPTAARPSSLVLPASVDPYDPSLVTGRCFNRILDAKAIALYEPALKYLAVAAPGILARKIPAANVQQAFVLDTVANFAPTFTNPSILCVGSFEDTAAAALVASGFVVDEIDPVVNYDLATYMTKPTCRLSGYDIIFSTSVLEHVSDDEEFLRQIGDLLKPGGIAVLTCDFDGGFRPGDPIPKEDFRLYTRRDLHERLLPLLPGCHPVDAPDLEHGPPDFTYAGCRYTFASLVFRKSG